MIIIVDKLKKMKNKNRFWSAGS